MLNTVIFDLDGTLIDSLADLATSVNVALRAQGLPERSLTEVRGFVGNGVRKLMERAVGDAMNQVDFEATFQTFKTHYAVHCMDQTAPFAGIVPLMQALKARGVKMGIVSNKLHAAVETIAQHFFQDYVGVAVGESAQVRRKPCPDGVLAAMEALHSRRDETIYVGDSEVDWEVAQGAGVACGLVLWGYRDAEALCALPGVSVVAHRPNDLLNFLEESCAKGVNN